MGGWWTGLFLPLTLLYLKDNIYRNVSSHLAHTTLGKEVSPRVTWSDLERHVTKKARPSRSAVCAAVPHISAGPVGHTGALLDQRSKSPFAADAHVSVWYWMKPPLWGDHLWLWLLPSEGAYISTAQAWRPCWQQNFLPFSMFSASPNNFSINKWAFLPFAHPGYQPCQLSAMRLTVYMS